MYIAQCAVVGFVFGRREGNCFYWCIHRVVHDLGVV